MDSRLGVIQPYQVCETCGGDYISYSGHIGHIELADPVVARDGGSIPSKFVQFKY